MVADSGVYLLHDRAVVFYPYGAPATLRPRHAPGVRRLIDLRRANSEDLRDLAEFARHPFGLTDEQLTTLARSMGREDVIVRRER